MLSIIESCLKSPLVRPGSRTLGLSFSFGSIRIALVGWLDQRFLASVEGVGAPVAAWRWSVRGGSERPRAALPLMVFLRIAIRRPRARPLLVAGVAVRSSVPFPQHPRACACVVSMSALPAGGLVRTAQRPWSM